MKTLKNQITKFLEEHGTSEMKDILNFVGGNEQSVRAKMSELKKKGIVESPEWGKYKLVSSKTIGLIIPKQNIEVNEMEVIDEFVRLKKKFGRENFVKIIEKWKLLLE